MKTPEEMAKEINEKVDGLKSQIENAASKGEIQEANNALETFKKENEKALEGKQDKINALELALKEQGAALTKLREKGNPNTPKLLKDELKANIEAIGKIAKGNSASELVVKANTVRSSIASNSQGTALNDIGQLEHRKLTLWDLFRKIPVSEGNNNGTIKYWDWDEATVVRAAAAIAEGATFPESTAKWKEETISLKKIGDTLPISEEFLEDEAMFAGELDHFLETNVDIKVDTDLATADGTGNNIKGIVASIGNYTPVASGIADANIYDLSVKVSESITATGGAKYAPDFGLMNISDINKMKLKKDANNNYVIPPFVSRDGKQIDTMLILECNAITPNTAVFGDSRFAKIYYKSGVALSKGYTGDQFNEDMMTLKARRRLAFLIRGADKSGFANVTSISEALTTLES